MVVTQQTQFAAATFSGDLHHNLSVLKQMEYTGANFSRDRANRPSLTIHWSVNLGWLCQAIGTGQAWNDEGLSFTASDPSIRQAAIERIKSHLPLAAHFDAVVIIGLIRGVLKPGDSHEQAMEWLRSALKDCSQAAEDAGVRLALEPINRYETSLINTVAQGMDLIDAVGSQNFGLLLDTFHMNIEEPIIEDSLRLCNERIFHFHVADSNRWSPGSGHLDFPSILRTLIDTGYSGFISVNSALPDVHTAGEKISLISKPIRRHIRQSQWLTCPNRHGLPQNRTRAMMHTIISQPASRSRLQTVKRIDGYEAIKTDYPIYLTDESKLVSTDANHLFIPRDEAELVAVIQAMSVRTSDYHRWFAH